MKRLLITLSALGCLFADISDDLVGNWKLSGLKVDYLQIARTTTDVDVCADVNPAACVTLKTIPAGAVFTTIVNGPFTMAAIDYAQLNLNVNLWPNGTGYIAEGSFYPDIDLLEGTCITSPQIFPVTDEFVWETGPEADFAASNILNLWTANDLGGQNTHGGVYGFGVDQSSTFDGWPSTAQPEPIPAGLPYIVDTDANVYAADCQTTLVGGACAALGIDAAADPDGCAYALVVDGQLSATQDGSGSLEQTIYNCVLATTPAYGGSYAGSAAYGGAGWLHGSGSSGYIGLNQGLSQMPGNTDADGNQYNVDLMLEWNAIDGTSSSSGLGDDPDVDEDGDGTIYDRIFGIPYLESTFLSSDAACDFTGGDGFTEGVPLVGDVVAELGGADNLAAFLTGGCLQTVSDSVEGVCLATVAAGVYDGCLDQVEAGVSAQCEGNGGVGNTVWGGCVEQANGAAFAGGCALYGVTAAVTQACLDAGGPATAEEAAAVGSPFTCAEIAAQYDAGSGGDCGVAAGLASQSCADSSGASLCCLAGAIGAATYADCDALAASLDESTLDGLADTDGTGATCTNVAAGLAAGLAAGDATAIATLNALAEGSAAANYTSCTDTAAGLAAGLAAGDAASIAYLDNAAAGVLGETCTQYGDTYIDDCVVSSQQDDWEAGSNPNTANATQVYVMDTSLTAWGLFLTANAMAYSQYSEVYTDAEIMTNYPSVFVNDSDHDFDGTNGRMIMNFTPTCVPEIEGRQIVAEFVSLDQLCDPSGDANNDGFTNVVDIVRVVAHILQTDTDGDGVPNLLGGIEGCQADVTGEGIINVVDVVAMVSIALGNKHAEVEDATQATILHANNQISIEADGYVAGIELVVEHTGDLEITFADNYIADYEVKDNTAHILLVNTDGVKDVLTVTNGHITSIIESTIATSKGSLSTDSVTYEEPSTYVVGNAYPNPFNPSTSISVELNASADLSVKVYNLMGQLVDVIAEGSYSPNTYNWTWNAENLASGVYLVKTQVGSDVSTQKVMLLK